MKRLLLLLVVLAVVAGGLWFARERRAISDGAQIVPADTVFYAALPDLARSLERWPKTALARIGAEPSVAAFLEKPGKALARQGGMEGLDLLLRVKPGRIFVAVTELRGNGADVVLGFQFFGPRSEIDVAFDRLYREMGKSLPNARRTTADYQGDAVSAFADGGPLVFSAVHGSWGFLANTEAGIRRALDRVAGRDRSPALATDPGFVSVGDALGKDADFAWFARSKPFVDALLDFGSRQMPGAAVNESQVAELRKISVAGGILELDGSNLREATFFAYPNAPRLPAIERAPMALTTPATTFFYDGALDLQTIASDRYLQSLPPEARQFLSANQIDLKKLPEMLRPEFGLIVNWSPSEMIPAVLAVVGVRDRAAIDALADKVLAQTAMPIATSEIAGTRVLTLSGLCNPLFAPAIAVDDRFFYASLTTPELTRVLSARGGSPTLESAEGFKSAAALYRTELQAFGYLDSKGLFEGIYNRVRPIAMLAAVVSPDLAKFVDIDKLPETEAISRHLSPILYSARQLPAGWIIESAGPVTLSQAVFAGAAGAVGTYVSQFAPQR